MERDIARLRLVSALVVLPASALLLVLARPLAAKVLALLGLLAAVGWFASFRSARARIRGAEARHLDIAPAGLTIALGASPVVVRWTDVEAVDVDEERLVVVLRVSGGRAVDVPPVWEGVGLHELHALIEGGWDGARRPPHR